MRKLQPIADGGTFPAIILKTEHQGKTGKLSQTERDIKDIKNILD